MHRLLVAALAPGLFAACAAVPPAAPLAPAAPAAQPVIPLDHLPALKGDYFRMESAATGRPYHIYVRLPDGYGRGPGVRDPVVYLLDGDSLFPMLGANHLFLTYDDRLPEAIIVGIAYGSFDPAVNKRHIDFAPPAPGVAAPEAGAPAFQRFLKEELIPRVERDYGADPARRILFGQSRGGGFVLYSAFTDPDLFWARIASNPTFDPGRERYFAAPAAASRKDLRLVVASGSHDRPKLREGALAWFRHWQRRDTPWTLNAVTIEDGTHSADSARVYRTAMRWLFGVGEAPAP